MIYQQIKKVVPRYLNRFDKLTPDHDPYYFDSWVTGGPGTILRYWFWNRDKTKKNKKRVFLSEIDDLLKCKILNSEIARNDFERYCPKTNGDGGGGYAVIIRILEHLGVVQSIDGRFQIQNRDEIQRMISP